MNQDQSRHFGMMLTLRTTWSRRCIADDTIWFSLTWRSSSQMVQFCVMRSLFLFQLNKVRRPTRCVRNITCNAALTPAPGSLEQ